MGTNCLEHLAEHLQPTNMTRDCHNENENDAGYTEEAQSFLLHHNVVRKVPERKPTSAMTVGLPFFILRRRSDCRLCSAVRN